VHCFHTLGLQITFFEIYFFWIFSCFFETRIRRKSFSNWLTLTSAFKLLILNLLFHIFYLFLKDDIFFFNKILRRRSVVFKCIKYLLKILAYHSKLFE